nr:CoA pyrophosphatase [Natronoarchaeum philippinense]
MDLDRAAEHEPREIPDEPYDAAVLAPVIERGDEHYLLFTKRADHLGEHPGQMSFPGGGRESVDESIRATALREANEEIGLVPDEADVIGQLDDIRTITEYAVTPFVARVPDRTYVADEREVAEIAVLPLSGLLDPENYEYERREHPHYGDIVIHYFHVDGYTVWGATGRIVVDLLELTTDWRAPERVDRDIA